MLFGNYAGLAFGAAMVLANAAFAQDAFIAGVHPDRRPENAPSITATEKSDAWYAAALTGISQPYPDSLKFLNDQGAWFTPFVHPGMTGRYDIRRWHQAD